MKVRSIFNSKIPGFFGAYAMVCYPFVFFSESRDQTTDVSIKHEAIHIWQIKKTGVFRFYLSYFLFYIAFRLSGDDDYFAYIKIPWEAEAYRLQYESLYLADKEVLGII